MVTSAFILLCGCIHLAWSHSVGMYSSRQLASNWLDDIMDQKGAVDRILDDLLVGAGKGESYRRLAELVDKFGNRFTGTQTLEDSIDFLRDQLIADGFENVHTEDVTVPVWVRGPESARMLEPREVDLYIMGLMNSIATAAPVEAEVIVVRDFAELYRRSSEAVGKIVVYNQMWTKYTGGYMYRTSGASHASNVGAVGVLIRSVTDYSLYTPHTGSQSFWSNITKIPSACITTEDAEMLHRMHKNNVTIRIRMEASHQALADSISRNLVAEIRGSELPDEVVMFGGHIDSWDVGVGAMDDGGGCMITRQILSTVKRLGLRPRRTLRLVLWTAEEIGVIGGHAYFDAHKADIGNMVLVMESDIGTFSALGLHFHNMSGLAQAVMEEILETYLHEINGDNTVLGGLGKADINDWILNGVPGASLYTQNYRYFHYHHTEADRMLVEDPDELDRCASVFAVAAYVVANMEQRLPQTGDYPGGPMPSAAPSVAIHGSFPVLVLFWLIAKLF